MGAQSTIPTYEGGHDACYAASWDHTNQPCQRLGCELECEQYSAHACLHACLVSSSAQPFIQVLAVLTCTRVVCNMNATEWYVHLNFVHRAH